MTGVVLNAGRIGWPRIVTYEQDGAVTACPPRNRRGFRLRIHDLEAYEELARSGRLYSRGHQGRRGPMLDNRTRP